MEKRFTIPVKDKKAIIAKSAYRCAFPGCNQMLTLEDGSFYGQLCHIEATSSGGPRYNPNSADTFTYENLILLCPNHHCVIDREPHIYTTAWLKKARDEHYQNILKALQTHDIETTNLEVEANISLKEALRVWEKNKNTKDEEFWQRFFNANPKTLAQLSPNCICQVGSKCFLGGKAVDNKGGNLIDFLYANSITSNVCLIEIKTPVTELIGKKYRANAFSVSHELSGSIVQVLNYRDELLKNFYILKGQDPDLFNAFNPKCIVIAGCFELQNLSQSERKSFELFRSNSNSVEIVTYDELFLKIKDIVDLIE